MWYRRSKNKLGNKKVVCDGIEFDSKREAKRYAELKLLLRAGKISDLRLQVCYELIPTAYEDIPTGEIYKRGEHKGEPKMKRVCIEHGVDYIADFVYTENGKTVVEDAKGYRDPHSATYMIFVIKRKLMLHRYGIRVREV